MQDQLTEMLEPAVEGLGYELLLLEVMRGKGVTLRLYIDHPNGITVDDCEAVSRQVSAVLEVEDPITSEYTLEVSSPGLDRPLVKPSHFEAYLGWNAKVMTALPVDGRRKFTGLIEQTTPETLTLRVDGAAVEMAFADIERARLVFDEDKYQEQLTEH